MVQAFYIMKYSDYKKHCHRLSDCVGHSDDNPLTDDSIVTLKVNGPDHVHLYLEQQGHVGIGPLTFTDIHHPTIIAHPIMKARGI